MQVSENFCINEICERCRSKCIYDLKAIKKLKMSLLMHEMKQHGHDTHTGQKKKKVDVMKKELVSHYVKFHKQK